MRSEVQADIDGDTLYYGKYLSPSGTAAFPVLLLEAVTAHDDDWLINSLGQPGYHLERYPRRTPSGGWTTAKVPYSAAETLGEGEFNRFYVRGLCLRALADGVDSLRVERVKEVANPRQESEQLRGTLVNATALLADLREHPGVDTALGVPSGPNSGLSVELP